MSANSRGYTQRGTKRKQSLDPGDPPYAEYEHQHARMELDSHADTCALGECCLVLGDSGRTVDVNGYTESLGAMKDVKIIHGAVAYD